jgi:hypothetical protein
MPYLSHHPWVDLIVDDDGDAVIITNNNNGADVKMLLFFVALGDLVVSVLATGPKVRGFKPGRGR